MEVFVFGDEQVISLQRTKVYVFSDSALCLGKINDNSITYSMGRQVEGEDVENQGETHMYMDDT